MAKASRFNPPPTVPPEVQDMIIDNLHDDQDALQSCALVCKQWLPASRYHLFHSITRRGGEHEYDSFLELLLDAQHIGTYIRELRLEGRVAATTLLAILRTLPDLTCVVLSNIVVDGYNEPNTWTDHLMIALLSMVHLRELCVCGEFLFSQPTLPLSAMLSSVTGLPNLTYFQSYIDHKASMPRLWRGLARAKSQPGVAPLRMLDVPVDLVDDCDAVNAQELSTLLKTVGEGLQGLMLDFRVIDADFFLDIERVLNMIDLSPCTDLRSLEIRILLDQWYDVLGLFVLTSVLSRIPSASLERLNIAIWNNDELEELELSFCRGPLKALDDILCGLPKLKEVTFRSVANDHGEQESDMNAALFEWLISHLPNIEKKKGVVIGYAGGEPCV